MYQIIGDMIKRLYGSHSGDSPDEAAFVRCIADRLTQWRSTISQAVWLDTHYLLTDHLPPPHILSVKYVTPRSRALTDGSASSTGPRGSSCTGRSP